MLKFEDRIEKQLFPQSWLISYHIKKSHAGPDTDCPLCEQATSVDVQTTVFPGGPWTFPFPQDMQRKWIQSGTRGGD